MHDVFCTGAKSALHSLRKLLHYRGRFPTDEAVIKLLYLALTKLEKRWSRATRDWDSVLPVSGRMLWRDLGWSSTAQEANLDLAQSSSPIKILTQRQAAIPLGKATGPKPAIGVPEVALLDLIDAPEPVNVNETPDFRI